MRRAGLLATGLIAAAITAWYVIPTSHPAAAPAPSVPAAAAATPVRSPAPTHRAVPVADTAHKAVTARNAALTIRTAPGGTAVRTTLASPNAFGDPLTMLVVGQQPGWYEVSLPVRPNGSTGWVAADDVRVRAEPYEVTIVQHAHTATLWRAGRVVRRFTIAVGKLSTPSPDGRFYVSEIIDNRGGDQAYGPWVVGLSAFSDVYTTFGGGDAQIALHGTDEDASVGQSVSHGCFRMHDPDATALAHLVSLGTPVYVSA